VAHIGVTALLIAAVRDPALMQWLLVPLGGAQCLSFAALLACLLACLALAAASDATDCKVREDLQPSAESMFNLRLAETPDGF